jgi:hypothetical protein
MLKKIQHDRNIVMVLNFYYGLWYVISSVIGSNAAGPRPPSRIAKRGEKGGFALEKKEI